MIGGEIERDRAGSEREGFRITTAHFCEAIGGVGIELRREVLLEQREKLLTKKYSPGHPLQIVPRTVKVRTVEASAERSQNPVEHGLVADMHAQCHVGLATIATKVTFSD